MAARLARKAASSRTLRDLGAYVVSAWLVGIASNLVTTGRYFDIAVRDLVMPCGAFALAKLTEARRTSDASQRDARGSHAGM
jgi:hypothetical protein